MTQLQTEQRETHEWLTTREALGLLPFSRTSLLKYQSNGYFIQGKHWVKNGPYTGSTTLWNIDAIWQTMANWSNSEGTEE